MLVFADIMCGNNTDNTSQPELVSWGIMCCIVQFRMKQSGVQNLIYLVESHGDNKHTSLPLDTLNQATINTQVVDRFTVKTTSSHRNSMHYLSIMTRLLSAAYSNKTIVGCRLDSLPDCHIRDDIVSLMTFSEFNNASSKTKVHLI